MQREYSTYKTLKFLSKQRVAIVLQPGNVWVIEKAMPDTEQNNENIQTCLMRGWVEVLHESVPTEKIDLSIGKIPELTQNNKKNIYRLTDSGWNAIHRTHITTLLGIIIAISS
ncbi:MAG TPA: hypothetical protein PL131_08705 [Methylotenera sp.]|nr:hypothetical protein [Methylotenera sp.]HPH05939.1 hypothetical protein [Methylotenera sp.]HPN02181.1 hypothetical protein [Methylotenera sp.]